MGYAKTTIKSCRDAGIPIIYAIHYLDPRGLDAMKFEPRESDGKLIHSVAGEIETEFCDEIAPEEGDIVFRKQKFTAWYGSKLDVMLSSMGIEKILLSLEFGPRHVLKPRFGMLFGEIIESPW